jgi:hypothetical protein
MSAKTNTSISAMAKVYIIVLVVLIAASILSNSYSSLSHKTTPPIEKKSAPPQAVQQASHKSTVLSFTPMSSTTEPLKTGVGETVTLDIMIDPGQNLVSFAKVEIQYDPTKLTPVKTNGFLADGAFSSIMDGPTYNPGNVVVTLSIGADPTKAIAKSAKAATIKFKTLAKTDSSNPTTVTFGPGTNILSLAPEDNASDNVLASTESAVIAITY